MSTWQDFVFTTGGGRLLHFGVERHNLSKRAPRIYDSTVDLGHTMGKALGYSWKDGAWSGSFSKHEMQERHKLNPLT